MATGSKAPIDPVLSNVSVAAFQDAAGFISDKVFPIVPVDVQSGKYLTFDEEELNRDTAERRADATESAGDTYELGQDNYFADVWALHKDVGDQLQANYRDVPGTPFNSAARFIAGKMRIRQERQFATDFLKTGVWGLDLTGVASSPSTNQFLQFDAANSDPFEVIETMRAAIAGNGLLPNVLAMGYPVWTVLKNHPEIIDRFKYTTAGAKISEAILADLFEVERVVIGKAIVNTAKRGKAAVNEYIVGKKMLLAHVADAPGIEVPTAGYTFSWTGVSDGLGETIGTVQFRMEEKRADRVESQIAFDNKVVAPSLAVYAENVVS